MTTGSLPLRDGIPYRLNELAELIGRTRPTVERYASKYSFEKTSVTYKGKPATAVVLTPENIEQIITALQQDHDGGNNTVITGGNDDVVTPSQQDHDPEADETGPSRDVLIAQLEAARERIDDLKARLDEQKAMYEMQLADRANHISTLKTSMVMMERLKRYSALDVGERKPGPLARLGQWLGGLGKPSKPAASYQQIDPVVETVEDEAHVG